MSNKKHDLPRISPWFYYLCLALCFIITKLLFRLKNEKDPAIAEVKGGLLIVSNHQSYTDPLFIATAFPRRKIHFVAGRYLFEHNVLKRLFSWLGVIAKQQLRPDAATIRDLIGLARKEATLFLFPEGQRSVNGRTAMLQPATGRLVKKLGLPVAVTRLSGSYLSWPRWGKRGIRLGKVSQETELLLTADEVGVLSAEAINEKLKDALFVDEYARQLARKKPRRYRGKARAERLDAILHWCPKCEQPFQLSAHDTTLACRACDLSMTVERSGLLTDQSGADTSLSRSPAVWHDTQVTSWHRYVLEHGFRFHAVLKTLDLSGDVKHMNRGVVTVTPTSYDFEMDNGEKFAVLYDGSINLFADYGDFFQLMQEDGSLRIEPENGQAVVACLDLILSGYQSLRTTL
ncbi:MAG TPA: 1-acyl-sn-glycerol-3-phosphate acyltransferase [Fastidiosipila sp.]|nr:1-acyl-sn-glycerol-3-phosphate acyltransferase [Fastidiosipila sp.]